jgi:hypothetical protein
MRDIINAPWRQLERHITAKNALPKDAANQIPVWVKGQRQISNTQLQLTVMPTSRLDLGLMDH